MWMDRWTDMIKLTAAFHNLANQPKNKSDTNNNSVNCNYFKIIQKIHEQHPGKPQNQELQKPATMGTNFGKY
jgi:hypothetical protein